MRKVEDTKAVIRTDLILRKPVFVHTPEYCMFNGKAANSNFIVFGLT
jgi:hypothetical protein